MCLCCESRRKSLWLAKIMACRPVSFSFHLRRIAGDHRGDSRFTRFRSKEAIRLLPATVSVIHDAIIFTERIMQEIDNLY